jgi:hypothetical protein
MCPERSVTYVAGRSLNLFTTKFVEVLEQKLRTEAQDTASLPKWTAVARRFAARAGRYAAQARKAREAAAKANAH